MSRSVLGRGRIKDMESSRRPAVSPRRLLVGLGLTVILTTAACSSGGGKTTASTTTAPTSTTVDRTEAAVLAGYRAFWVAYLRAADPMDPRHPDLVATATGAQLEQVQKAFLARFSAGEVIRGTIEPHPRLVGAVQGTAATVADCYIDDAHIFDATSGAQKDDPAPVNQQIRADMVLVDSTWRVAAIHHEAKGCTPS